MNSVPWCSAEWKPQRYACAETLDLGFGLTLAVDFESIHRLGDNDPKWNVYVFGRRLIGRSESREEAKQRAVRIARRWLKEALSQLEEK
jgi:hypothetical protein